MVDDSQATGTQPRAHQAGSAWGPPATVLVAIRHLAMRRWTIELLASEPGWAVVEPTGNEMIADAIRRFRPTLVIVDSVDFPSCCQAALRSLPPERVIVIGPEPDHAYRARALALGAGGWVSRDHVAEQLRAVVHAALHRSDDPSPPPSHSPRPPNGEHVTSGGNR